MVLDKTQSHTTPWPSTLPVNRLGSQFTCGQIKGIKKEE